MQVTDGALTPEFRNLRLPLGTGLLGLFAQIGATSSPRTTESVARVLHREFIDDSVAGAQIPRDPRGPAVVDDRVIGALLAVHRRVRPFPSSEVSLLTSFAAHASVALENARLFAELDEANRTMTEHTAAVESAAHAHDRLTDLLLHGGGVAEVARVVAEVLGADLAIQMSAGDLLAGSPAGDGWQAGVADSVASGRSVEVGGAYVAAALAGTEHVATLVLHHRARPLALAERRTLERGALVTALVLLFARTVAQTEERLGGGLLTDLLEGATPDLLLRERARRQRVVLDPPLVVAVASVARIDRHAAARVATRLATARRGLAGSTAGPSWCWCRPVTPSRSAASCARRCTRPVAWRPSAWPAPAPSRPPRTPRRGAAWTP